MLFGDCGGGSTELAGEVTVVLRLASPSKGVPALSNSSAACCSLSPSVTSESVASDWLVSSSCRFGGA